MLRDALVNLEFDFKNEVIKDIPIIGTGVADCAAKLILGLSLNDWFYAAAVLYTFAQIGLKITITIIKYQRNKQRMIHEKE